MKLRILVVDDSIFYRKIVTDVLSRFPDVEVVGTASNGQIALTKIKTLKPDLITLDVEMPVLDGLEVLKVIKKEGLDVGVIMVSTLTTRGGKITMKALELGAFDFITKTDSDDPEENLRALHIALLPRIRAFARRLELRKSLREGKLPSKLKSRIAAISDDVARKCALAKRKVRSEIVAIGISTGGPNALTKMLPRLPGNLGVPIVLVQHMPSTFTKSLAESLDQKCSLRVKEAEDGEVLEPNTVYIAPGGKQMKVATGVGGKKVIRITDDPPENNCKPAADYLFRSVAKEYRDKATGVIMTGMGQDGTLGLKVMKSFGAVVIAQDAESCVVYGMPKAAVEADVVDIIAPLDKIAQEIVNTVRR
ncbi:protein-glutamate methylesterase/protein-glutamine glutaminase [Desulfovulcanus sp.]